MYTVYASQNLPKQYKTTATKEKILTTYYPQRGRLDLGQKIIINKTTSSREAAKNSPPQCHIYLPRYRSNMGQLSSLTEKAQQFLAELPIYHFQTKKILLSSSCFTQIGDYVKTRSLWDFYNNQTIACQIMDKTLHLLSNSQRSKERKIVVRSLEKIEHHHSHLKMLY